MSVTLYTDITMHRISSVSQHIGYRFQIIVHWRQVSLRTILSIEVNENKIAFVTTQWYNERWLQSADACIGGFSDRGD